MFREERFPPSRQTESGSPTRLWNRDAMRFMCARLPIAGWQRRGQIAGFSGWRPSPVVVAHGAGDFLRHSGWPPYGARYKTSGQGFEAERPRVWSNVQLIPASATGWTRPLSGRPERSGPGEPGRHGRPSRVCSRRGTAQHLRRSPAANAGSEVTLVAEKEIKPYKIFAGRSVKPIVPWDAVAFKRAKPELFGPS